MPPIERRRGDEPVTGVERTFELQVGSLGGFELRPTRLFLWTGDERGEGERIVPFGGEPRSLDLEREEHELRAGSVRLRTLGNPLMTIALAGVHAVRRLANEASEDESAPRG
jgi:hypothetical protein